MRVTGHQPVVVNLGKYQTFGEMGLFDNSPAISDVIAMLDTEVIEIDNMEKSAFVITLALLPPLKPLSPR